MLDVAEVVDGKVTLRPFDALLGETDAVFLLVLFVIVLVQGFDEAADLQIDLAALIPFARNDKRSARLVDQDAIHLVDDGENLPSLHHLRLADGHIVPEVIKTEGIVGGVKNVAVVRRALFLRGHPFNGNADGKAKEAVHLAHPFRVTFCEVIVDRDDVHAFARKSVQISGEGTDQRLTFTGAHLGDPALMQGDAAQKLHVKMAKPQHSRRSRADHGVRIGKKFVQRGAFLDALLKIGGHRFEFLVRHRCVMRGEKLDLIRDLAELSYLSFIGVCEYTHKFTS